ncbi:metalloendopeptidase [Coemansia sp. RSA 720]|nr:metalloendopeptidase [Coemansia sp. RSA 720]
MYEVWDKSDNKFVGHAYLDLFVRKGKYSGAAVWAVRPGFERLDGTHVHPVSAMVANFAGPTSTRPALMSHGDIKIILHELAHLFHNICSVTKWSRFHGTSCRETDYVEAPSQMMENWAWEPAFLRQFAKHYKTGEPISDKMLQNLINTRNDELGMDKLSQLFLGMFDLSIHNSANGKHNVSELFNSMQADMAFSNCGDAKVFKVANCEHLMGGYAGTYYSYLWAEIISADMFATRFKAHGIDNPKTGMDFRREILLPGGSRDASVSLEQFLGRKPNSDAFFKMISH